MVNMQLKLFDRQVLDSVDLVAQSPKNAFYRLRLVAVAGKFCVEKESGASGRVLDRRCWEHDGIDEADRAYAAKLRAKTNPKKITRRYSIA